MTRLTTVNLIHLFDFYLAAMFVVGTWRRLEQYRHTFGLVFAFPGRWPRLLRLVRDHRTIFLTWKTLLPSALALLVWLTHTLASRLIWHHASLTVADLGGLRRPAALNCRWAGPGEFAILPSAARRSDAGRGADVRGADPGGPGLPQGDPPAGRGGADRLAGRDRHAPGRPRPFGHGDA